MSLSSNSPTVGYVIMLICVFCHIVVIQIKAIRLLFNLYFCITNVLLPRYITCSTCAQRKSFVAFNRQQEIASTIYRLAWPLYVQCVI